MTKNPTPRSISFFASLLVSILVGFFSFFLEKNPVILLSIVAITFFATYFIFLYAIEIFIYRKIKLVYKNIHTLKVRKSDSNKNFEMNNFDPITDVEKEV